MTGTLSPIQDAEVGFKMGGRLVAVRAKVGDRVKAGQALASLDVAEAAAQSATAAAGVRAAEVALEMAKDGERRLVALFDGGAISDSDHTGAKNRTALAAAQLEQARAQARLAAVGVGNGGLSAPFSGLITRTPNGIGKIVGPGEPLFHVEDTSVLKLAATLSETDARLIENGDAIVIDGSPAAGKVVAVLGSLDAQTRRVPLLAEIPNDSATPLLARLVRARHDHRGPRGPGALPSRERDPPRIAGRGRRRAGRQGSPRARRLHHRDRRIAGGAERRRRHRLARREAELRDPRRRRPRRRGSTGGPRGPLIHGRKARP